MFFGFTANELGQSAGNSNFHDNNKIQNQQHITFLNNYGVKPWWDATMMRCEVQAVEQIVDEFKKIQEEGQLH